MLNLSYHSKELKFRLMYCLLSWVITFGCVYMIFEEALFALSPAIPTFFLYGNALEVLLTKVTLSLALSWWQVLPHMVATLWLFIRPGLREYESSWGPTVYTLVLSLIIPWILYYLTLDFVAWTLQNLSSYYYRFLPSLSSTSNFIAYLLMLSNFMALFPRLFLYFLHIGESIFKKLRLVVVYIITALAAWVLPPDVIYLALALFLTTVTLEGLYFIHLLLLQYNRPTSFLFRPLYINLSGSLGETRM